MHRYARDQLANSQIFARPMLLLLVFVILIGLTGAQQQAALALPLPLPTPFNDNVSDGGGGGGVGSSSTINKASLKINMTILDSPHRSLDHLKFYIQEYPKYRDTIQLNDAFSPDDGSYFPKVTFTLEIPQGVIADRKPFHLCISADSSVGKGTCYTMVKHTGSNVERITIDTGKL
jgi:hypothetical protein